MESYKYLDKKLKWKNSEAVFGSVSNVLEKMKVI